MLTSFNKFVTEEIQPGLVGMYALEELYHTSKSKFQQVDVVKLTPWGRTLLLDEKIQSTESDEYIYHEALVHPSLLAHPNPKRVFIAGGGEGATAREVLRHKSVERVVMVDIDDIVCKTSKEFLPKHHRGAFDNPRYQLIIEDAKVWLQQTEEKFDVMVLDLADPVEDGPAYMLYTKEFYTMAKERLAEDGIIITQAGPGGCVSSTEVAVPVYNTMKEVFPHVSCYLAHIPSFLDLYAYVAASNTIDLKTALGTAQEIDRKIEERLDGRHETDASPDAVGANILGFYDGESHQNMFALPKWLRTLFKTFTIIITDDSPRYML